MSETEQNRGASFGPGSRAPHGADSVVSTHASFDPSRDSADRANARRHFREALAWKLRNAWHRGDANWWELASIAMDACKAPDPSADAVFVIEVHASRTSVRTSAPYGVDPATLLRKAIEALEAEAKALAACPAHASAIEAASAGETPKSGSTEGESAAPTGETPRPNGLEGTRP